MLTMLMVAGGGISCLVPVTVQFVFQIVLHIKCYGNTSERGKCCPPPAFPRAGRGQHFKESDKKEGTSEVGFEG